MRSQYKFRLKSVKPLNDLTRDPPVETKTIFDECNIFGSKIFLISLVRVHSTSLREKLQFSMYNISSYQCTLLDTLTLYDIYSLARVMSAPYFPPRYFKK